MGDSKEEDAQRDQVEVQTHLRMIIHLRVLHKNHAPANGDEEGKEESEAGQEDEEEEEEEEEEPV